MELSPLLVLAIVLLVLVAGLTLWQRRAQADHTVDRASAGGAPRNPGVAAAPASPPAIENDPAWVSRTDPVLGKITFDGDDLWEPDDDVAFAGTTVVVQVTADANGPTEAQREILRTALDQQQDLDRRARAAIRQELDRQGVGDTEMDPFDLSVKPDGQGGQVGFLWYDVSEADREMGVSSTDHWRTLKLETLD